MRYLTLTLPALAAITLLATSAPALADGARVEVQGGVGWGSGQTAGTVGGAVGYDASLGAGAFAGAEISSTKVLARNTDATVSLTGRLGLKPSASDRLFVLGGYTFSAQPDATHLGGGWEHNFAGPFYGSLEYRHFFTTQGLPDRNTMTAGVGLHF